MITQHYIKYQMKILLLNKLSNFNLKCSLIFRKQKNLDFVSPLNPCRRKWLLRKTKMHKEVIRKTLFFCKKNHSRIIRREYFEPRNKKMRNGDMLTFLFSWDFSITSASYSTPTITTSSFPPSSPAPQECSTVAAQAKRSRRNYIKPP